MGKAAEATQPELPGSQTQGNGDRDMLAQSPTAALKCRWQRWCQTPCGRKHQQCFMRHKRYCGKGLKPQMWTNDPCRAELPRREVWGAMVDSGAPKNFGMEMLRARAQAGYVSHDMERSTKPVYPQCLGCHSSCGGSPYKERTVLAASPTESGHCPSPRSSHILHLLCRGFHFRHCDSTFLSR